MIPLFLYEFVSTTFAVMLVCYLAMRSYGRATSFSIFVAGKCVLVTRTMLIKDLKKTLGLPRDVRLCFEGKPLRDSCCIGDYYIYPNATLCELHPVVGGSRDPRIPRGGIGSPKFYHRKIRKEKQRKVPIGMEAASVVHSCPYCLKRTLETSHKLICDCPKFCCYRDPLFKFSYRCKECKSHFYPTKSHFCYEHGVANVMYKKIRHLMEEHKGRTINKESIITCWKIKSRQYNLSEACHFTLSGFMINLQIIVIKKKCPEIEEMKATISSILQSIE